MGWAGAIVAVIGLITGIYRVFFSKTARQDKWRKKLYELDKKIKEAYLVGDEQLYRRLTAERRLLLDEGNSSGFKR